MKSEQFRARSKSHFLFAVALDFYKLTRNKNTLTDQLVQVYLPCSDSYIWR